MLAVWQLSNVGAFITRGFTNRKRGGGGGTFYSCVCYEKTEGLQPEIPVLNNSEEDFV